MKPDFALSLSFVGISLSFRAADGWRNVGDVTLDTEDLAAALAHLRDRAVALAGDPVRCKIVIPNDQIRYLTISTGSFEGETRQEMARAALEGATPYDVADLVFDLAHGEGQTQIAAVARETLNEAETFARTYGFSPVSFVAIPEAGTFAGEPFFGPATDVGTAGEITRDDAPVRIVGPVEPAADAAIKADETPEPSADDAPDRDPEETKPQDSPSDPRDEQDDPDTEPATAPSTPPVSAGFASRRRKASEDGNPPPLAGARRDGPPPAPIDAEAKAVSATAEQSAEPPAKVSVASPRIDLPDLEEEPVPSPEDERSFTARFLSRRKRAKPVAQAPAKSRDSEKVVPAPPPQTFDTGSETERMTIFGARDKPEVGGKPRHLGLVLTIGLLLFLAAVAAWSALFLDDRISGLFGDSADSTAGVSPPEVEAPQVLSTAPGVTDTERGADRELDPAPGGERAEDLALLPDNEIENGAPVPEDAPEVLTPLDDMARYAATGIWQRAPAPPDMPATDALSDLYDVSIDRRDLSADAVALPPPAGFDTDQPPATVASPVEPGTAFDLDERGLVRPTADGAVSPDGVLVFLGRPPVVPPPTPTRFETDPGAEIDAQRDRLAAFRPRPRPDDLAEQTERSQLGGLTLSELGRVRPRLRPESVQQEAEQDQTPTAQAVVVSRVPQRRPGDFAAKVQQAQQRNAGPSTQVATATVAPRTVTPRIPSSASVARRATIDNAINLRRINLIGVYGTPSNRRALVRLPNGRYKKVKVGDRVDGGRVLAIGDSELRYQKSGRNMTLKIPSG